MRLTLWRMNMRALGVGGGGAVLKNRLSEDLECLVFPSLSLAHLSVCVLVGR